jgi:hypothetical protein
MRKWQVSGFERFLIFYLPRRDGGSIVRVLHAAGILIYCEQLRAMLDCMGGEAGAEEP